MMEQRTLGRSGLAASALGMGCWAIGGAWWDTDGRPRGMGEVDDAESVRAIHCALDHGVTFFDTADAYGAGHSEVVLGRALRERRGEVTLCTKFGNVLDEAARRVEMRDGLAPSRAAIRAACRESLRRLGTDYIDLYLLHIWSIPPAEMGGVLDALDELAAEGLIRAYGWSTDLADDAACFAARPGCGALQFEANVLNDAPAMHALCAAQDLGAIVRSPLAMGLLSGKYGADTRLPTGDIRGNAPEWMKYFQDGRPSPEWFSRLEAVRAVLTSGGRTLAQGALAWLWARSERAVPISGFKTVRQVEENTAAMAFGPLTPAQMAEIDALLGRGA